jgi:hypothetical protein
MKAKKDDMKAKDVRICLVHGHCHGSMLFGTEHVKIFLLKQGHVLQKLNHSMALS